VRSACRSPMLLLRCDDVEPQSSGWPPQAIPTIAVPTMTAGRAAMNYARMVIEKEAPEEYGYDRIRYNLSESSIADQKLSDIGLQLPDLTLFYGEHRGERPLRDLIAAQDAGISPDHVLVTAGAAGALFIIATSLLSAADHLVVVRPNYATNIETPRAIGCEIGFVDLSFDEGFAVDLAEVEAALRPNTRIISVTCPH